MGKSSPNLDAVNLAAENIYDSITGEMRPLTETEMDILIFCEKYYRIFPTIRIFEKITANHYECERITTNQIFAAGKCILGIRARTPYALSKLNCSYLLKRLPGYLNSERLRASEYVKMRDNQA